MMLVPTLCDLADNIVFHDKFAAYLAEQERLDRQCEGCLTPSVNDYLGLQRLVRLPRADILRLYPNGTP